MSPAIKKGYSVYGVNRSHLRRRNMFSSRLFSSRPSKNLKNQGNTLEHLPFNTARGEGKNFSVECSTSFLGDECLISSVVYICFFQINDPSSFFTFRVYVSQSPIGCVSGWIHRVWRGNADVSVGVSYHTGWTFFWWWFQRTLWSNRRCRLSDDGRGQLSMVCR